MGVGGINFLLICDFEISKLPIKLSKFHEQVLLLEINFQTQFFSPQYPNLEQPVHPNKKEVILF